MQAVPESRPSAPQLKKGSSNSSKRTAPKLLKTLKPFARESPSSLTMLKRFSRTLWRFGRKHELVPGAAPRVLSTMVNQSRPPQGEGRRQGKEDQWELDFRASKRRTPTKLRCRRGLQSPAADRHRLRGPPYRRLGKRRGSGVNVFLDEGSRLAYVVGKHRAQRREAWSHSKEESRKKSRWRTRLVVGRCYKEHAQSLASW
mmetsp:Transcript_30578/g.65929  ORF Transcript_30578/g.65929 Transcript_30578/m.65929 type:complete len:201 (-) Transcript_30578:723-1325(-)